MQQPLFYFYLNVIVLLSKFDIIKASGTQYNLTKNYEIKKYGTVKNPKNFRVWDKVKTVYSSTAVVKKYFKDNENTLFLA